MKNRKLLTLLIILSTQLFSCATLSPSFVQATKEHREDTFLVNNSLIATFQEEMDIDERPEAKAAYREIINNLNTISHQSEVLESYVWDKLTEEELILVLRSKWRAKP